MSSVFILITPFLHHIISNNIGHPTMGNLAKNIRSGVGRGLKLDRNLAESHFFYTKLAKNIFIKVVILIYFSKWPLTSIPMEKKLALRTHFRKVFRLKNSRITLSKIKK
ncbi:unnamed protein product [Meganyctiphanes norvegica]|uniref:Uncharacterized protein n=1 Tax=Meganyctiphanes norvegica TaxID=48144 RepID=A0AAV2RDZ7_MEGNR